MKNEAEISFIDTDNVINPAVHVRPNVKAADNSAGQLAFTVKTFPAH